METVDSWGMEVQKPVAETTLAEFNRLDELRKKHEDEKERLAALTKLQNEAIAQIDQKALLVMQQHNMKKHVFPSGRTATLVEDFSFRVPEGPEERKTFFEFCRENFGEEFIYEKFKMNSQSLQPFCREIMENALEAGDLNFQIPGVPRPKPTEHVKFKAGRK